jgi:hypothetical protein
LKHVVAELTLDNRALKDCKDELRGKQSAKMYPAYLWRRAPGHNKNPRALIFENWSGLQ